MSTSQATFAKATPVATKSIPPATKTVETTVYTVETDHFGYKTHYKNGIKHRDGDEPAVEGPNGYKAWYNNGKLHRVGGPAVIDPNEENEAWYINGEFHRDGDEPACITKKERTWYKHGVRHRYEDKPAVVKIVDGYTIEKYYKDGKRYIPEQCEIVLSKPLNIDNIFTMTKKYIDGRLVIVVDVLNGPSKGVYWCFLLFDTTVNEFHNLISATIYYNGDSIVIIRGGKTIASGTKINQ